MKKSSSLYKQIMKAQKAMRKWPKDIKRDIVFIPAESLK
jgi:hypothetical protein